MSTVENMTTDELTDRLVRWSNDADCRVQAAVGLLVEHGYWLNRAGLRQLMIHDLEDDTVWLRWSQVREALNEDLFRASTTEMAVLDFAVALAEDRYRWSSMGDANRRALATATNTALGLNS